MGTSTLNATQKRRGIEILKQVEYIAHKHNYHESVAYNAALAAIACALTESNLRVLANPNVAGSAEIPHDGMGSDHASVGLFQQQVPMWGSAAECMNVAWSTTKFINRIATYLDMVVNHELTLAAAIQQVQVSAFEDGSNYQAQMSRAHHFVAWHWNKSTRTAK